MDFHRPTPIVIPLETWIAQREHLREGFGQPHDHAPNFRLTHLSTGHQRLRVLFFHIARTLHLLIHGK